MTKEHDAIQRELETICTTLLKTIGEDVTRDGLILTPTRWAKWWMEFINYNPGNTETTFESISTDQMIIVKGIKVWSICEHHLLPFRADISIGYITKDKVLGLSKFARISHQYAHKLQLQEGLVKEIADEISRLAQTDDVAVLALGEHLCMQMRGIRSEGTMVSSYMGGGFRTNHAVRSEFLSLVNQ